MDWKQHAFNYAVLMGTTFYIGMICGETNEKLDHCWPLYANTDTLQQQLANNDHIGGPATSKNLGDIQEQAALETRVENLRNSIDDFCIQD